MLRTEGGCLTYTLNLVVDTCYLVCRGRGWDQFIGEGEKYKEAVPTTLVSMFSALKFWRFGGILYLAVRNISDFTLPPILCDYVRENGPQVKFLLYYVKL